MCGIAGEVRFDGGIAVDALQAMSDGIRHRGPDDDGLWLSDDGRCGLAFRRLAIIDVSPAGHQPMRDPETGNTIVFNGEIYNYRALRRECESRGDTFRSASDTEVILALYRRYGAQCLRHLRGMFALAIWDARARHLFVARDRLGKKPFNYAVTNGGMVFCSEIWPLSHHPSVSRELDPDALDLYLQLQSVPSPLSIYRAIHKLPPAHYGIFSSKSFTTERYWDVDYQPKVQISEEEALAGLEEKLTEAVQLRMIADVPLGALLSGGVDSSLVVAIMSKLRAAPVKTFSVGFHEENFNELPYANEVARIYGTDHHPLILNPDIGSILPRLVRHYGEPYADPSAIPSFFVCEAARQHVTVVLNGDGGDELLGGYPRYRLENYAVRASQMLGGSIAAERLGSLAPYLSSARNPFMRAGGRLLQRLFHPELASVVAYNALWNDGIRKELVPSYAGDAVNAWRRHWLRDASKHAGHPVDRMLYFDNHTYLPDDLLAKIDIASMHCSLEARSPLLDQDVIEYCSTLPADMKVRNGNGKYLLKRLAEKSFSKEFVQRPKMGFGIPVSDWLRGPLREQLFDVVQDTTIMAPLERTVIRHAVQSFLSGTCEANVSRVWSLFMYGLWRKHVDMAIPTQNRLTPAYASANRF